VPILFVLAFLKVTRLSKSQIIIDWHNYGYSILRVNHVNKWLVALAKIYEMVFSKCGDHHLCVSRAMQIDLQYKFGIKKVPHVLYDKATRKFRSKLGVQEMHEVLKRAKLTAEDGETLFTRWVSEDGQVKLKEDRPVFVLSSTSYTPDEDFMVLVNALDKVYSKV
jgi:beta-1,4-mannosyltransferase